jgi:signal transduction histidine kinase
MYSAMIHRAANRPIPAYWAAVKGKFRPFRLADMAHCTRPIAHPMSLKLRLALLLGLLFAGFGAALLVVRGLEHAALTRQREAERHAHTLLLTRWIDLTSRTLPQFTADAAQSGEFIEQLAAWDTPATRAKVEASLASAGVTALWVMGADGMPRLRAAIGNDAIEPPLGAADFVRLVAETPSPRFFAEQRNQLFELSVHRLATPNTNAEWLMVARRWDDAQLRALAQLTESAVSLGGPMETVQPAGSSTRIVLVRPLPDWQGHPLRTLRVEYDASAPIETETQQGRIFFVFGLLLIVAMTLAMRSWVLRPLGQIAHSLATSDPEPARVLGGENSELGQVARLVATSFAQRRALELEVAERTRAQQALERSQAELHQRMEERARLGRDLHDGVIQTLYAAGMGLASIRSVLNADQVEAATRLEQTRAALNETIHDVRNFIIGLEPEALKLQTFSQAVAGLLEVMQGIRPLRTFVEIDEQLASRLTLAQRVHALQITREAVSNAIRHGAAGNVWVALRSQGEFAMFEVRDDGSGFDPQATGHSGHGLANFVERARELGAELTVQSQRGYGTLVKLVFSLVHYD